jgi:antitoxin YefM
MSRVLCAVGIGGPPTFPRASRRRSASWPVVPPTTRHNCGHVSIESLREVRDHFSAVVDRVEQEHDRVTVTRNGRQVAVILSPDDLAQLEETLEILSDEAPADIREADAAYCSGDVVRGIESVRSLRA